MTKGTLIFGVGRLGQGKYKSSINGINTKSYNTWIAMLARCYDPKSLKKRPTYAGCTVCEEWLNYQNFAEWYVANYFEGCQLDKDKKVKGNKVYSPDTCELIPAIENHELAHAKSHTLRNPDGQVVTIYNLAKFARENKLNKGHLWAVINGKRNTHKGWTRA